MSLMKSLFNTFMIATAALAVASCVPKATEKKAICGANEAFDSVTRSCYSIEVARRVPVGTASSASTSEETPKTITLTYTDANQDKAQTCSVSSVSSNIVAMSPWILDGGLFDKADEVYQSASDIVNNIPPGADTAAAALAIANVQTAYLQGKGSLSNSTVTLKMGNFKTYVGTILTLATHYPANVTVQYFYTLTQQRLAAFTPILDEAVKGCACTGGVCTTTIVPKINKNGAAGFSYTITDVDGPSVAKAVSLSINAMSLTTSPHLAPVAESSYVTFSESATSLAPAAPYTFTIPDAADLSGTATTSMKYYFKGTKNSSNQGKTTYGLVTNCMDLVGSTGLNDKTCTFTPNDFDNNNTITGTVGNKAFVTIAGDLTYTAKAEGFAGNSITIQYLNLTNDPENFGLVSPTSEAFVRVVGNDIKVYLNPGVTSSDAIATLITNHLQAKHLVNVSGGSVSIFPNAATTPTAVPLATGANDFDVVLYSASNGSASSAIANVMISMTLTNDIPMVPKTYIGSAYSHTEAFLEEDSRPVDLVFKDVDNIAGFTFQVKVDTDTGNCNVNEDVTSFTSLITSTYVTLGGVPAPVCVPGTGICTVTVPVISGLDFSGKACIYYRVIDGGAIYSDIQSVQVTVTNVNDAPQISKAALPTITALGAASVNEDVAPGLPSYKDIYVGPGGDQWEVDQLLTINLTSSNTTIVPNTPCIKYTPGTATPVNSVTPLNGVGSLYLDKSTYTCYISTGTTSATWIPYPSLTAIPLCAQTVFGQGAPSIAVSAGAVYLDTTNNVCYKPNTTITAWVRDAGNLNYKLMYIPAADQSSTTPVDITVKVIDNGSPVLSVSDTLHLTVNMVDDPPVFVSAITTVETNEGGAVQSGAFTVDEDAANTDSEDAQYIKITSITSDNQSVLPDSAIKIFYDLNDNGVEDAGESRVIGDILEAAQADDVRLHNFYLKLDPVDGVSGNANVTITISDGANPASTTFSFIVHPIAALHGGWSNISSVGLKTDKTGAPASAADIACNYNLSNLSTDKNNCGASACTSTATITSPNGVVTPSAPNTIYWDSSNKRCYRSTGITSFTWVDHNISCPVTMLRLTPTTLTTALTVASTTITVASTAGFPSSGVIKIDSEEISYTGITATTFSGITRGFNSTTAAVHAVSASVAYRDNGVPFIKKLATDYSQVITAPNQYLYHTDDKSCHRSYYDASGALVWDTVNYQPSKVTLAWKPFVMAGAGINGWNVYRREANTDYNFRGGHLKDATSTSTFTITGATTRTFTDTTAVAGKVYYYEVRPVDDTSRSFPTYTPEAFSEVRVIAAPANYSFVHRWIVNQEICNGMNITNTTSPNHVDQTQNFRCEYSGVGSVNIGGTNYYDFGKDLLVDTQESGCAYAAAPSCTANGCIGIGAPTGYSANVDDLYYDRNAGKCYITKDGSSWSEYQLAGVLASAHVDRTNSALNAPLTNITAARAGAICAARTKPALSFTISHAAAPSLPTKKDYMAYASQKLNITDPEITDMEQGFSLNIQSRCNGSAASGLETAYTDSAIPSTSFIYSLPGTYSSGIRSLYTGSIPWGSSYGTEACVSRFGIQDLYGNVAEWVNDGMTCDSNPYSTKVCTAKPSGSFSATSADFGPGVPYAFNNQIGPFAEGGDGIVGFAASITSAVAVADTIINVDSTVSFATSGTIYVGSETLTYTGITATTFTGVSAAALAHAAGVKIKANAADDSFLTQWTFADELFGAGAFNYPLGLPMSQNIDHTTFSAYMDWVLSIGPSNGITTNKLHEDGIIVNATAGASKTFAVGGSYLSGNRAGRFSSELIDDTTANRPDVGFRCIIPVNTAVAPAGDYPADTNYNYPN